jgi:acetoacetyl-CoA synthetase
MTEPMWRPSAAAIAQANMTRFIAEANRRHGLALADYAGLHAWSVTQPEDFWRLVWEFCEVVGDAPGAPTVADRDKLPGARWFPNARLNFAENLLRRRDDSPAMVFRGEDKLRRSLSHAEVYDQVSRLAQALAARGVGEGDRVAGFLPNLPETVIAMLAAASLGAIWSSCSPDFGVGGVLDRFGQIEPKVLFVADGYWYGGKRFDALAKARAIVGELSQLKHTIVVPYTETPTDLAGLGNAVLWDDALAPYQATDIAFRRVAFNAPLYIMYSSGTTGRPKCIVHGVGGTLIQHLKEHRLHCDIRSGDRLFYFTTCGWMMWNWLATGLASGATLMLYDGSPFHPDGNALFDFARDERFTHFGTSAKWIDAIAKAEVKPAATHDLSSLRVMLSTGSPLAPQGFDHVYRHVKADLHLASISGGTDIISCFVGGVPLRPVWRGEIQGPMLGMAVAVFDDDGKPLPAGRQGELVCTNSFPSMPVGFWNDPDGSRYRDAYFATYPGVWRHGDWIELTDHGGYIITGRSDATLNPGGVRIGTAEIYRQVEALEEILEAIVIGQAWDGDTRVVLFVRLKPGFALDEALRRKIRARIRDNASPRHVPAKILEVADIPRTVNGKITELAVTDVVHGRVVKNKDALLNPEALDLYKDLPELRS